MQIIQNTRKEEALLRDDFMGCTTIIKSVILARVQAEADAATLDLNKVVSSEMEAMLEKSLEVPASVSLAEKLVLMLAITPHIRPGYIEQIIAEALPQGGEFVAFGGVKGQQHRGIIPTGETALYLLAGMNITKRLDFQKIFNSDAFFASQGLLHVEHTPVGEPQMSGRLIPDADWLEKISLGTEAVPVYSANFPARRISTEMHWDDLVLHPQTAEQISDIQLWMEHHTNLLADTGLGRRIKPGYRVLFHGQAGTGKTLTASLLGKRFELPVYRIDLSQVISKYIGETEKHIELVFNRAERKKWILFFDEADALFGKRTQVQSSNDKFANQEVSYLLQRIEDFEGLLILASNFKNNIDDAFLRRFHNIIHFPIPGVGERLKLWTQSCPESVGGKSMIPWESIAEEYEMTGAEIVNVMFYASLKAFSRKDKIMTTKDVLEGIRKEYKKQDKNL